jgi:hypothetical protein
MDGLRSESRLVSFGADAAVDAALDVAGPELRTVVEYTAEAFRTLYVGPAVADTYDDDADREAYFERVHSYVQLDFTERDLFEEEVFPRQGRVRSLVAVMDDVVVARILRGTEGVVVSTTPGANYAAVVDAVEDAVAD